MNRHHRVHSTPILQRRGNYDSLSPRERAGVRGNDALSSHALSHLATKVHGDVSPKKSSHIAPLTHRAYSAPISPGRGNNFPLSLGGEGRGEGARTLDRLSNFQVHGEGVRALEKLSHLPVHVESPPRTVSISVFIRVHPWLISLCRHSIRHSSFVIPRSLIL